MAEIMSDVKERGTQGYCQSRGVWRRDTCFTSPAKIFCVRSMGCGAAAQAILDDCRCNQSQNHLDGGAEAGNLCSRYTALVCGGKRINL